MTSSILDEIFHELLHRQVPAQAGHAVHGQESLLKILPGLLTEKRMKQLVLSLLVESSVGDLDPRHSFFDTLFQRSAGPHGRVEDGLGVHAERFLDRLRLKQLQRLPVELDSYLEGTGGVLALELEAAVERVPVVPEGRFELMFEGG